MNRVFVIKIDKEHADRFDKALNARNRGHFGTSASIHELIQNELNSWGESNREFQRAKYSVKEIFDQNDFVFDEEATK